MKKQLTGLFLLTFAVAALAQGTKSDSSSQAARAKSQPANAAAKDRLKPDPTPSMAVPAIPSPTGPTGFGSIKLGMTKDAVLALSNDEPIRIVGELTPTAEKTAPPLGTERFDGTVTVPLVNNPVKVILTFNNKLLQRIYLSTEGEDSLLVGLAKQVSERYGPGKVEDDRKDEQCIYRNGNSFILKSGPIATSWTTPADDGKIAKTSYTDYQINSCPSNLRHGLMLDIKIRFFTIEVTETPASTPKKNYF